jgi:hypothetical protein
VKRIVTAIAALALLVAAAPATAKQKTYYYDGKTVAGESLAFAMKGKRISDISGYISTTCVPTSGTPIVRTGEFNPPGSFRLGRSRKVSHTEYISYWGDVTKNYRISITKGKGRVWTAKLHVNFSYTQVIPVGDGQLDQTLYVCQGDDAFKFIV